LGIVAFVLVGCALTGFVISMATSGKFIGVEMVGVVQAAFIGLMAVSSMGPSMGELAKIGFINGVNMLFSDSRKKLVIDGTISPSETPYRIGAL
jgi:ABC-type enterochelin transport system permease subunit